MKTMRLEFALIEYDICKNSTNKLFKGDLFWEKFGLTIQFDKSKEDFIKGFKQHQSVVDYLRRHHKDEDFSKFFGDKENLDYYGVLTEIEKES
jgi:hypothetical protein